MREVVLIPCYKRYAALFCCLKRIVALEPNIPIHVFPDRGTFFDVEFHEVIRKFDSVIAHVVGEHDWNGNTSNTMNAFLWAFNEGFDRIFYVEEDIAVHEDFFSWHRLQHELWSDIFCSMGWVFNQHAPINNDLLFQPWYYSIGTCFSREKLELIVRHATPRYYQNMPSYIGEQFSDSKLNSPFGIAHYEQDGLIQRVLERDGSQTVVSGIAKCTHFGSHGYNKLNGLQFSGTLEERVALTEDFISDPWWRAEVFGRPIVEREIGHELKKREFHYRLKLAGGWESDFKSELTANRLPGRINSVNLSVGDVIVLTE